MPKIGDKVGKKLRYDLHCGDALVVLAKIPDNSIDFIVTDPPYGHSNNDGDLISNIEKAAPARRKKKDDGSMVYEERPIANDKGDEADGLVKFLFEQAARLLKPGGCIACCCGGGGSSSRAGNVHEPSFAWWSIWMDQHVDFKMAVVWDKGPIGMGWHYRRSYEFVLIGQKPGAACKWYDESGSVENILRPGGRCRKIIPSGDDHPTPKPSEMAAHFMRLHTQQGDVVLDPFMGAGWVGEAAKKLGRSFIGVELDPHWYSEAEAKIGRTQMMVGDPDTIREPPYEALFNENTGTKWR